MRAKKTDKLSISTFLNVGIFLVVSTLEVRLILKGNKQLLFFNPTLQPQSVSSQYENTFPSSYTADTSLLRCNAVPNIRYCTILISPTIFYYNARSVFWYRPIMPSWCFKSTCSCRLLLSKPGNTTTPIFELLPCWAFHVHSRSSAIALSHQWYYDRFVVVWRGASGDIDGRFHWGAQLGNGGHRTTQGGHHEQEVVGVPGTSNRCTPHGLGGDFGGAL